MNAITSLLSLPPELIEKEISTWLPICTLVLLPYVCKSWNAIFNQTFWQRRVIGNEKNYLQRRADIVVWASTASLLRPFITLCIENVAQIDQGTIEMIALHLLEAEREDLVNNLKVAYPGLESSFLKMMTPQSLNELLSLVKNIINDTEDTKSKHAKRVNYHQLAWITGNHRLLWFLGDFLHRRLSRSEEKRWIASLARMDSSIFHSVAGPYITYLVKERKRSKVKKVLRVLQNEESRRREVDSMVDQWNYVTRVSNSPEPWKTLITLFDDANGNLYPLGRFSIRSTRWLIGSTL